METTWRNWHGRRRWKVERKFLDTVSAMRRSWFEVQGKRGLKLPAGGY
jgi:hypothetical protein